MCYDCEENYYVLIMTAKVLPLVIYPDARLNEISAVVDHVDDSIRKQLNQMSEAVFEYQGLGISGVQLGIMKRLIVIDHDGIILEEGNKLGKPLFMVNAEIIAVSEEKSILNEGCLSLPVINVDVERPIKVKVKYLDYDGKEQLIESNHKILAKCLQHEVDHTNGKLIIDYIKSPLKKQMIIKKLQKYKKSHLACECHGYAL